MGETDQGGDGVSKCDHEEFTKGCPSCAISRMIKQEKEEHEAGCQCPVFFPDYCPVHGG